ncbi:hypothetical protein [Flindersiella endophytica]
MTGNRKWIAAIVAAIVVLAGAAFLLWPKDSASAVPEDLCSFIGDEALATFVPKPELQPHKDGESAVSCTAKSEGANLSVFLQSGDDKENFDAACRNEQTMAKSKADLIKPSETAEFGEQMCGEISYQPSQPITPDDSLPPSTDNSVWIISGDYGLLFLYGGPSNGRTHELVRTLDLARVIVGKLQR